MTATEHIDYTWIDTPTALERWCHAHPGSPIAIDTESDQFHAYRPSICLVQVAINGDIALIDSLALDDDELQPLQDMLADPQRLKIMHAADNDLLGMERDFGFHVEHLFDTRVAAHFLSLPFQALGKCLQEFYGVKVSKKYQRLDWASRPLPEGALRYASLDVYYLVDLHQRFSQELQELGWLEAVEQESEALTKRRYKEKPFVPEQYLKIKGARTLSNAQQAVLHNLYVWRHSVCLEENLAAFLLLADAILLEIARHRPKTPQDLARIKGLKPRQQRRYGREILQNVREAPSQIDIKVKGKPDYFKEQATVSTTLYDRLRQWRQQKAEQEQLDLALLANNQLLLELAKTKPTTHAELAAIPGMQTWRLERYGGEWLDLLRA